MSQVDVLRRIRDAAKTMQQAVPCDLPNLKSPPPPDAWYSITPANNIHSQLIELGLPSTITEEMSAAFLNLSTELRLACESSLRSALQDLASKKLLVADHVEAMREVWLSTYRQQTKVWADSAVSRARSYVRSSCTVPRKKPNFNHEYIPLLEKYFEYNAYPCAPDRTVLARKSMMTPRQIEVWFQNHRNRAKKEGKTLRKLSSDPLPLELSLQSLEQRMPIFVVPASERKATVETVVSESEASDEEDTETSPQHLKEHAGYDLTIPAPNHAFPTTYLSSCQYVPFPCKFGKPTFAAPVWSRKHATSLSTRPIGDFDDFVTDFSTKLVLREAPSKNGRRKHQLTDACSVRPWFAATHTFAPPAPHPALIRPSSFVCVVSNKCSRPILAVSAPPLRLHPFRSLSPSSEPTSLRPPTQTNTAVGWKVSRLPKRTLKDRGMVDRGVSPATSEASFSSSSRSSSTSRLSSSDSTRRRSSSSSSSSSSSTVTTPILSSTLLPEHAQSPVSVAGVDFQDLDGLFGDLSNTVSPDQGPQLNLLGEHLFDTPSSIEKQRFRFGIEVPSSGHAREPP